MQTIQATPSTPAATPGSDAAETQPARARVRTVQPDSRGRLPARAAHAIPGNILKDSPSATGHASAVVDFGDPQLPVNYVAADFPRLEQQVLKPDSSPLWRTDDVMDFLGSPPGTCKAPTTVGEQSREDTIRLQIEERQRVESRGQEFQFPPFLTTLDNLLALIDHIEQGQQFPGPLLPEEAAALLRLKEKTTPLVKAQTPFYKRTIYLALSLMVLCEVVAKRQRIAPWLEAQPGRSELLETTGLSANEPHLLSLLPWMPAPADSQLGDRLSHPLQIALFDTVSTQDLLLYPSFHPLTLEHFCRLAHLPVHPVGLTGDHTCCADGFLMTPLQFALHDLDHMRMLKGARRPGPGSAAEPVLCLSLQRLNLCHQLLDRLPDALADNNLKRPLTLLLFELLHEKSPAQLDRERVSYHSVFLFFLTKLAHSCREHYASYTDADRQFTDSEAAVAALWAASVWERGRATDFHLTPEQQQDHARTFISETLPRLQRHLDFLAHHKGRVRQLLMAHCAFHHFDGRDGHSFSFRTGPCNRTITLFRGYYPSSGLCNQDHTDLGYFAVLHSPAMRQELAKTTGQPVPPGTADAASRQEPAAMDV